MKVRCGFVSNSSSTSFIVSISPFLNPDIIDGKVIRTFEEFVDYLAHEELLDQEEIQAIVDSVGDIDPFEDKLPPMMALSSFEICKKFLEQNSKWQEEFNVLGRVITELISLEGDHKKRSEDNLVQASDEREYYVKALRELKSGRLIVSCWVATDGGYEAMADAMMDHYKRFWGVKIHKPPYWW